MGSLCSTGRAALSAPSSGTDAHTCPIVADASEGLAPGVGPVTYITAHVRRSVVAFGAVGDTFVGHFYGFGKYAFSHEHYATRYVGVSQGVSGRVTGLPAHHCECGKF